MGQESFQVQVLAFFFILALNVLAAYYISRLGISYLHQSTIAISLGLMTGLLLKIFWDKEIQFSDQLFFALLLPPIVFSVGYTIQTSHFFNNLGSIVVLGVLSTLLSVTLFTVILTLVDSYLLGDRLTAKDIVLLAICVSASDPVATLPLIRNNHPKLNAIVSGESVINSAVAIILFSAILSTAPTAEDSFKWDLILKILLNFSYRLICSFLLGLAIGLILSFIFKKVESFTQYPIKETSLILLNAYMVFLLAQLLGLSGIIALFTTAIVFSLYGIKNLSDQARHGTVLAFQTVRYISQAFVFSYLGASLLNSDQGLASFGMAILILILIPLIRVLSSFFIPLFYKITRKPFPVTSGEKKMLWYCGLMRGVIAFAISLLIQSKNKQQITATCLNVVVFITVLGSSLLKPFATWVKLDHIDLLVVGKSKSPQKSIEMMPSTKYEIIGGGMQELHRHENGGSTHMKRFKSFEEKFIRPIFIKEGQIDTRIENTKLFISPNK